MFANTFLAHLFISFPFLLHCKSQSFDLQYLPHLKVMKQEVIEMISGFFFDPLSSTIVVLFLWLMYCTSVAISLKVNVNLFKGSSW